MRFKIMRKLILLICFINAVRGKALNTGGCYECEEEVWEEVPCDDIPPNSTTISTPYYNSTSTYKTTTPYPKSSTMPTTAYSDSMLSTTTYAPSTMTTAYPTTSSSGDTTPKHPYKKCYCECKVGCKEFCRKVVVNSPENQIVQVSKISQVVDKGRLESTHFHQHELIPKNDHDYNKNDDNLSDDEPEGPPYNEDSNSIEYSKHDDSAPPIESATGAPFPLLPNFRERIAINPAVYESYEDKPALSSLNYYSKTHAAPVDSVYQVPYERAEPRIKSASSYATYHSNPQNQLQYYSYPNTYNFQVPFENLYSKVSKLIIDPADGFHLSLDAINGKYEKTSQYLPKIPVRDLQFDSRLHLDNSISTDDSFDSLIKEFIGSHPSHTASYESHSRPLYSVSYSR